MGWNSWNQFRCQIDEKLVHEMADALVARGLGAVGYQYVILDDCWQAPERGPDGGIRPDPIRFPNGMRSLSDYIHSKGLKFGIYTSVGKRTCQGRPGSWDHEDQDAQTYADWGVDFVKDDFCGGPIYRWISWNYRPHYVRMSEALLRTGRPIVFSLCNWGWDSVWKWGASIANLWRTTMDISPHWRSVLRILDHQRGKEPFSGPGHWNDPDMLEVGVSPLTETESRSHFSLWAMLAAPLIAGNDLRTMTPETTAILTNPEVIAVDQDQAGKQGFLISSWAGLQVWAKPLAEPETFAVVLLNRKNKSARVTVRWNSLGLPAGSASVRDLWKRIELGSYPDEFSAEVFPHGVVMVKVTPTSGPLSVN